MKRKLVLGLVLATAVLAFCGVYIAKNLADMSYTDRIKDRQESIVKGYDRMLYLINDVQSLLYAIEAGHYKNRDILTRDILEIKKQLSFIKNGYSTYASEAVCKYCHPDMKKGDENKPSGKLHMHGQVVESIYDRIVVYEKKINLIVASGDPGIDHSLVQEAADDSEGIEAVVYELRNAMDRMDGRMEEFQIAEVKRSTYLVTLVIIGSILLSAAIVIVMIRSITGPMNKLVRGIEKVSSGDYASKVDIRSNDEFGFLAGTFNQMTGRLNETIMQKDALMEELKDLNSSLDQRVQEATAELRTAHEMVLRNETLSAVGTFASGVAHELATPIASIMTYFQMVKERVPKEDRLADDVQTIEKELKRCNTILRGMLDFARAPEKGKTLTDINAIVHDLLALVRYQPSYKRTITIKEDLATGIPMIPAVAGQLRQVFMNMIVNALQSMPGGGTLSVSTGLAEEGRKVVVTISDTGRGIPQSELDRIFRPFYTGRETGTGLGLSISFGIITGHGGDIEVKSEGGKGTTFFIYLPISSDIPSVSAPVAEENAEFKGAGG